MSPLDTRKVIDVVMFSDDPKNKHTVIDGNRAEEVLLGHVSWERISQKSALEILGVSDDHYQVYPPQNDGRTVTHLYQLSDVECWMKIIEVSPTERLFYFIAYDQVDEQSADIDDSGNEDL